MRASLAPAGAGIEDLVRAAAVGVSTLVVAAQRFALWTSTPPVSIAEPPWAANFARPRPTTAYGTPAPAASAALSAGKGLSRIRENGHQRSTQNSRPDQLKRLTPGDGAGCQPYRQVVEGVLLRWVLRVEASPSPFSFIDTKPPLFPTTSGRLLLP